MCIRSFPKILDHLFFNWCALFFVVALLTMQSVNAKDTSPPANLLMTACHFHTDIESSYPSMLSKAAKADCQTEAQPSRKMVWLSLDLSEVAPKPNTNYELALFRHWTERAVIQIHYADGYMHAYDVGSYAFDQYWSVGNFVTFEAPARASKVSNILIGLQNPSSVKLFRQINFVETENWENSKDIGRILTTIIVGILIAMLCYNIVLAIMLKFDFHLHYCLFVFSILLYNLTAYGFVAHFAPGTLSVGTQMNITILALALNGWSGIFFLCSFLEEGTVSKRWKQTGRIFACSFIGVSFLYVIARGWHADTTDLVFNLMSMIGILYVFTTLVKALRRGSRAAIFYVVGWALPIIGVILRILRGFDIIPHSAIVEYGMSTGMAVETIILSIGIADRISEIKKDRDQAKVDTARARASSKAKSDFLAHMSHEIRTPMNAIIGLSDVLDRTKLDTRQKEHLKDIRTSSKVLLNLLNGVLDYSKAEAGKLVLEKIPFKPRDIFADLDAIVGSKAREKGLSLTLEGVEQLPEQLSGDPTRLGQILINLTNNAVKFTNNGHINIHVMTEALEGNNIMLKCQVKDTGIGMTNSQISKLFQSYSQGDASVTRIYGGTGLGLAICKQLIDLMDGSISVTSEPDAGSTFYFSVPMGIVATETIHNEISLSDPPETIVSGTGYILLVEDNKINQRLAATLLNAKGFKLDIAENGKDAIALASQNPYDVILMDLNLPGINGFETAKSIQTEGNKNSLIIALTANDRAATLADCLEAGMKDVIEKPIQRTILYEKLDLWLSASQSAG